MARKAFLSFFLSFFLSIVMIEMGMFLFILPGCKGHSPILPIMPPVDNPYEDISPSDDSQKRMSSGPSSNVKLFITGPPEYLTSELEPRLITESQPTFSARMENPDSTPDIDDFIARIDTETVRCDFDPSSNEVRFTPSSSLQSGNHFAMLYFKNPEGSSRMLWWSFRIETKPPMITGVMWNKDDFEAVVFFDREVEPRRLMEAQRWSANNDQDIFSENISKINGGFVVFLPLTLRVFQIFEDDAPLTITYIDVNGPTDYVINRGGSMREAQVENPTCINCPAINVTFLNHNSREIEPHAYGFVITNRLPGCKMEMEVTGWTMTPVKNRNPVNPGYGIIDEDDYETGVPQNNPCMHMSLVYDSYTFRISRNYTHVLDVTLWADCLVGPNGTRTRCNGSTSPCETKKGEFPYNFKQDDHNIVDYNPPEWLKEPTVLYGDEVVKWLEEGEEGGPPGRMTGIPFAGEPISGNQYCFGMSRDNYEYEIEYLLAHACDLFILAEAKDNYGLINPAHYCLDYAFDDGSFQYGSTSQGEPAISMTIDYLPFSGSVVGGAGEGCNRPSCDNCELDCAWGDHRDPQVQGQGGYWQDWCGEESSIWYLNLTEILSLNYGDKEISGIKVRVADNAFDPISGVMGNWRRSTDVLEQLCNRRGQRGAASEEGCGTFYATVKFVANNLFDFQVGWYKWKIYNYDGDTTNFKTSIISRRDANGVTDLHLVIMAETDDRIFAETQDDIDEYFPETMDIQFHSDENLPEEINISTTVNGLAVRYDLCEGENSLPDGLDFNKMLNLFENVVPPPDVSCYLTFYYLKLKVTDNDFTSPVPPQEPVMNVPPVLYVSSRDHMLGEEGQANIVNMLDCAESQATHERVDDTLGIPSEYYGEERGIGSEPSPKQRWFGYDEFIINGGFEVVEVISIDERFYLVGSKPYVPVQSEADVMLIHGHGIHITWARIPIVGGFMQTEYGHDINQPTAGADFYPRVAPSNYRPNYETISYHEKSLWDANMECFLGNRLHPCYLDIIEEKALNAGSTQYQHCCDFESVIYPWEKGEFKDIWLKEGGDTRWLALLTCTNMSSLVGEAGASFRPDKNWQKVIQDGYLRSVCGFGKFIQGGEGFTRDPAQFTIYYSQFLRQLMEKYKTYEPGTACYLGQDRWDSNSYTQDPSVAAWMEAAWKTIIETDDPQLFLKDTKIHSAAAVDANYKWYIKGADKVEDKEDKPKMKIFRQAL